MRNHEIENWALNVIDRVESRQSVEDSTVELKCDWPDGPAWPASMARRIAGHANASRGAPILWLIGVDEEKGITGATYKEKADWYPQIEAQFDGLAPRLAADLNIPVQDKTVVALYFETDRLPFVVKNPDFGTKKGEWVELEVPWREATRIRSARREDLVRVLSPLQLLPDLEFLGGRLRAQSQPESQQGSFRFELTISFYAEILGEAFIAIPFHRCTVDLEIPGVIGQKRLGAIQLGPRSPSETSNLALLSKTIYGTDDDLVLRGPGRFSLKARESFPLEGSVLENAAQIAVSLHPVKADHPIEVDITLPSRATGRSDSFQWVEDEPVLVTPAIMVASIG